MIELLRFATENLGQFLVTVLFLGYILFLATLIVGQFKPINNTYITNTYLTKEETEE